MTGPLLRRRRASAVFALALLLVVPASAVAVDLTAGAQTASTPHQDDGGQQMWRVWARRDDAQLYALTYDQQPAPFWADYSGSVGPKGVSAASFSTGGGAYSEWACYVGTDGQPRTVRASDGSTDVWGIPGGQSFTGHVASHMIKVGTTNYFQCFATTNQGRVYVHRRNVVGACPGAACVQSWLDSQNNARTDTPIAASNSSDRVVGRMYYVNTAGQIRMSRVNAGVWLHAAFDQIAGGLTPCGTMTAAEAPQGAGAFDYRTALICTQRVTADTTVYIAYQDQVDEGLVGGAWDVTWNTRSFADTIANSGYASTVLTSPFGTYPAFDAYVLTKTTNKILHIRQTQGSSWTQLADLGQDPEATLRSGGLAATRWRSGATDVVRVNYLGEYLTGGVDRMFSRIGLESYLASNPWSWLAHQSGDPRHTIVSGGNGHSEASAATWRGKWAVASMSIVTDLTLVNADTWVDLFWSNDDGDTWTGPTAFPVAPAPWDIILDPAVDFDDTGTAWVSAVGDCNGNCQNPEPGNCVAGGVHTTQYFTTTDGVTLGPLNPNGNLPKQTPAHHEDHTWLAIERLAAAPDNVHWAWFEWDPSPTPPVGTGCGTSGTCPSDVVSYVAHATNQNIGPKTVVETGTPAGQPARRTGTPFMLLGPGAAPVRVIAWRSDITGNQRDVRICRLAADNLCDTQPGQPRLSTSLAALGMGIEASDELSVQGGSPPIITNRGIGWAMYVSPTDPNRVYYVHQCLENNGDTIADLDGQEEKDICFATLTVDPVNKFWTPGPPVMIAGFNDNRDQAFPTLTVHPIGSATSPSTYRDGVFVTYYDRSVDCPGGEINRCFQSRMRYTSDTVNWYPAGGQLMDTTTISDVQDLPVVCNQPSYRFLGDYRFTTSAPEHSGHLFVTSPAGAGPRADLLHGWVSWGYPYW